MNWVANIINRKTRRFYKRDVAEFMTFTGLRDSSQLQSVTHAHVIVWGKQDLEVQELGPATVRRKLSALSLLGLIICVSKTPSWAIPWMA